MKSIIIQALIAVLLATSSADAQQPAPKSIDRYSVTVTVSCDDELLRNEIKSYVARELRELADVDVVERAPSRGAAFGLVLVAIKTTSRLGAPNGWAVSWVV